MTIICIDVLGGAKYPDLVAGIKKEIGIGIFWEEFGPAKNLVIKEAAAGRAYIRVQGLWAKHSFSSSHEAKAIQIAKELQVIATKYPNTLFELSPYCEHEQYAAYMTAFLTKLKTYCPRVGLVNCPDGKGQFVSGFKNELHFGGGLHKPHGHYNCSYDGLNCLDADVEGFKSGFSDSDAIFYWCYQLSCHANAGDSSRDARPTKELLESLIWIAEHTKNKTKLQNGFTAKSHSQQNNKPTDPRANHVVIVGPKGQKLHSVKLDDIALTDGGMTEEHDPRQRRNTWRSNLWGYKQPRTMKVVVDGKSVGEIDPAFRNNEERNHS